jgi:hypothetical protein
VTQVAVLHTPPLVLLIDIPSLKRGCSKRNRVGFLQHFDVVQKRKFRGQWNRTRRVFFISCEEPAEAFLTRWILLLLRRWADHDLGAADKNKVTLPQLFVISSQI